MKSVFLIQYFVPAKPVISRVCGCGHQRFIPEPWYNFAGAQDIEGNEVWLQLARRGNVFGIHYSTDGKEYRMARLANLPMGDTIKVGLVAQSPLGEGGDRYFRDIELKRISLKNIRNGNE